LLYPFGPIDTRANRSAQRAPRPTRRGRFSWKVVQARAAVTEDSFPDATERTLVAPGVYPRCGQIIMARSRPCSCEPARSLEPSVDVSSAPNTTTRTYLGVADLSTQQPARPPVSFLGQSVVQFVFEVGTGLLRDFGVGCLRRPAATPIGFAHKPPRMVIWRKWAPTRLAQIAVFGGLWAKPARRDLSAPTRLKCTIPSSAARRRGGIIIVERSGGRDQKARIEAGGTAGWGALRRPGRRGGGVAEDDFPHLDAVRFPAQRGRAVPRLPCFARLTTWHLL
jgi:hypothetical protein